MTIWRILPWSLLGLLVGFSVATFDSLPADIPRHLNAAGAITSSVPRTWWSWMMLPLIALATQALLFALTMYLPKNPELFNFPEKDKFLKLPPAYRGDAIVRMQEMLDVVAVFTMVVMCVVQFMMYRTAHGAQMKNVSVYLIVGTVALIPAMLLMTTRVNSAVDAAVKKWRAAGSPAR